MEKTMHRMLGILILACVLTACSDLPPRPTPIFQIGQLVQTKIGEHRGHVIEQNCARDAPHCTYDVRFVVGAGSQTDTGWFADGPMKWAPMARVNYVREFEIEAAR